MLITLKTTSQNNHQVFFFFFQVEKVTFYFYLDCIYAFDFDHFYSLV